IQSLSCGTPVSFQSAGGFGNPSYPNGMNVSCYYSSGQGGLESIYKFIAPATGTYQLSITAASSSSYVEYYYKSAANICDNSGWTCINYKNSVGDISSLNLNANDSIFILLNAESTTAY